MGFLSKRVNSLPPYLFSVFEKKKRELQLQGIDVIDLGIGSPDLPTPEFVVNCMAEEIKKPENHRYSPYPGTVEYRQAVARFYKRWYDVDLDPDTEVLMLIGSKEGIANMITAVCDPGDAVLIPDPGYPVYQTAVHLAGGESIHFPLDAARGYTPAFDQMDPDSLKRAKLMFLNYPGNPTAATAELQTFADAVEFAGKHDLGVIHDAAYSLVTFGEYKAPSILQVPGSKDRSVEFGSLSKSFNMTGWRIGYAVGNRDMIRALSVVKSNTDTGQFLPIQKAAAAALDSDFAAVKHNNAVYAERLEVMLEALEAIGIKAERPRGTFFIWAPVPAGLSSARFAERMLEEAGIIITPGHAFGPSGEGYFRISLSVHTERLREAAERMKSFRTEGARI